MTHEDVVVAITKHENEIKSLSHRMKDCEQENESIRNIAISVNKLAVNMEHMLAEQKAQGERLTALERAPAEGAAKIKDTVLKCIISSILSALLGALAALILK